MAATIQQQNDFINAIAPIIMKYAPKYNIKCPGAVITQACKESGFGTSFKAQKHNYFGLKYRPNRCPSANGTFVDGGSEQNPDGTYRPEITQWFSFPNMEAGVIGYFDFINTSSYKALKGETDPYKYLKVLEGVHYFTSLSYVKTAMELYNEKGFKKYDDILNKKPTQSNNVSANSPLISYVNLAPANHKTSPRNHKIDTITIHCYVGQVTAKQGCDMFATTSRNASCNYVVGRDGSIGLCVEEKDRSWCSSNAQNDHRAVTIECASDAVAPYKVTPEAYNALIQLVADICRRNGIKKLLWRGDKSLIGQIDKQNMTVHRWFAAKACPGDYLYNLHGDIANKVNSLLGVQNSVKNEQKIAEVSKENKTSGSFITYTIQKGDTLNKIAEKFGTKTEIIRVDNNIEDINKIITGKQLKIRAKEMTVKTRGSALNIRSEANTHCPVLGAIPNKSKVNVLQKVNAEWYKVEFNGIIGFCSANYLV